ncbi:MAG: PIN domain-containing protein [Candidatus Bathyarchaeia archaeon]
MKSAAGEQKALEACAQIMRTKIVELNSKISLEAADISLDMNLVDSIIVATAKAYNAEIITSDKHLKGISGVRFIE